MGVDAKGRNFSAPRLTPGVRHELMTYGSPSMIKEQDRQIAIMEDRARRYGYTMGAANAAKYGGITARALGTNEGYRRPPVVATTRSVTAANSSIAAVKAIVITFVLIGFAPFIFAVISMIIAALSEL